ncbi:MAG: GTPase ObgE [Clostridia bacterium]|nr:GTPase ObgE [Clostridia bacterium]
MFVDYAEITVRAGAGGAGAVSFRREKYVAAGGPDGGDGGDGGSVVFKTDTNMSTLSDFRYKRKYTAADGAKGMGSHKTGKRGADEVIRVPPGTIVREKTTGTVVADMKPGSEYVAAKGGKGGRGNCRYATPTRQIPRFAQQGEPGEEWELTLELRLLADVGLVGMPNVGKSTLISAVSEARPKIADYHFTTLTPSLGVVRVDEETSFVMADIPGLIEGAAQGLGLGHDFLRHIRRCRLLVHVVDVSGSEGRDPVEDFEKICAELAGFDPELARRPMIVAASKTDMASDEQLAAFRSYVESRGLELYELCAPLQEGTRELVYAISEKLAQLPPPPEIEVGEVPLAALDDRRDRSFTVTERDGVFLIEAEWIAKLVNRTDFEDHESARYFETVMERDGVYDELRRRGIKEGDTVGIYELEFTWVP